eukprot:s155_g34.t1
MDHPSWERLGRLGVGQKPTELVEEDRPPELPKKPTEVLADDESTFSDVDSQDEVVLKRPRRSKAKKRPSWFQKQATQAFQQQLDRNRKSFEESFQKREQDQQDVADMETSMPRISKISSMVWKVLGG